MLRFAVFSDVDLCVFIDSKKSGMCCCPEKHNVEAEQVKLKGRSLLDSKTRSATGKLSPKQTQKGAEKRA